MDYQLCGLPIDCSSFRNYSNPTNLTECVSGCFCSNDYVLEDGKCTDPAMCPGELSTAIIRPNLYMNKLSNVRTYIPVHEMYVAEI